MKLNSKWLVIAGIVVTAALLEAAIFVFVMPLRSQPAEAFPPPAHVGRN